MGYLNLGSLLLGLIAWAIPLVFLASRKPKISISITIFTSFTACTIALLFQFLYEQHLVNIEDWSALSEIRAVVFASSVLIAFTILFNAFALVRNQRSMKRTA
ncbi:hypothetical protein [Jeotgalibacillus aurantiacus]|uniref:hypothetical protein n=1 Tax=Jeotgalibacillus aurantiacus TaxID=2763266 RepID=UPI001D0A14BB|nr:hypothetical protein [Jeotgalibacillus aurantiacus]